MNKVLFLGIAALAIVSCEKNNGPLNTNQKSDTKNYNSAQYDADNTGVNVRDRNERAKTSFNQSESEADRTITQKIRQLIVDDSNLSSNAKNIKIITSNGVVTLRGPVANSGEVDTIVKKASAVAGVNSVENQLDITK